MMKKIVALKIHGIRSVLLLLLTLYRGIDPVGAQPTPPDGLQPYATFTPSMAIIVVILVAALFFMVFFSIYIRRCSDSSGGSGGRLAHALSFRSRRNGATRGLDPAVVETFPTFSYSEVKDHKIGKGALECAVCLNEFDDDETLRLLPKCDHVFHPECVDAWLEMHVTCPVCRANLVPVQPEPASTVVLQATSPPDSVHNLDDSESNHPRIDEIAIQVGANLPLPDPPPPPPPPITRNPSIGSPPAPPRSWSIRPSKVFGFGKFRSHSTGHSLVQPGDNLDRFTLRLPEGVRKEVMDRASLNRTRSCAFTSLPREGSSRLGYRTGSGEGSIRTGRFYRRLDRDGGMKSDQWGFLTRGFSVRSKKVVAETGSGPSEGTSRGPAKMPSFRCLEPKTVDEAGLVSEDMNRSPV